MKKWEPYYYQSLRFRQSAHIRWVLIYESEVPICGCQAGKGEDKGEEDDEENDIGAKGADEEDEAYEACVNLSARYSLALADKGFPDAPMKSRKNAKLALKAGV